jgi:hypothetical protein
VTAIARGGAKPAVSDDTDWPAFVTAAVRHGVAQPVAALLLQGRETRLPADVEAVLHRLVEGNRRRNLAVYAEIERLLPTLSAAGIEALVLKGVALSLSVYPDFEHRNFADVDILVRETNFDRAHATVLEAGWCIQRGEGEPSRHHVEYERFLGKDILTATVAPEFDPELTPDRLAPYARLLRLEVHRSPFFDISGGMVRTDLSIFWQDPQPERFPSGAPFLAPSREAMLVHLCAHAATHAFQKAQFVLDVALLLRRYGSEMSLSTVAALAGHYRATEHVRRLLGLLDWELGIVEAKRVLSALPGKPSRPLTWQDIFEAQGASRSENRLRHWLAAGTARERVQGAFRMLMPTPAAMRSIYGVYHPALLPALYVWRPIQLTGRLIRILARKVLKTQEVRPRPRKEYPCSGSEPS